MTNRESSLISLYRMLSDEQKEMFDERVKKMVDENNFIPKND